MPELIPHRLSDDQIRAIFGNFVDAVETGERTPKEEFICHLAAAIECTTRADFLIMRGLLVLMIAKHDLARYLEPARRTA